MVRVGTWNVNSVTVRLPRLLDVLARHAPDYLCLQEIKCTDDKFPYGPIRDAGYHAEVFGQKTYNGVAILSREKPATVTRSFPGVPETEARYLAVETPFGEIASVYVPNGQEVGCERYFFKLDWLHRLRLHAKDRMNRGGRLCLLGDFNVAPEPIDVHDPAQWNGKILFSQPERQAIAALFAEGMVDVFRKHNTRGGNYSWWDYRQLSFPRNNGLRIDLILADPELAAKSTGSVIDRDERKGKQPSDHVPVFADFSL